MSDLSSLTAIDTSAIGSNIFLLTFMLFLLLMSAVMSGTEMALASVNRIRIKNKAEDGNKKARKILTVLGKYDEYATTVIITNNVVNILLATISSSLFAGIFIDSKLLAVLFSTVLMTIVILIVGEIIPKIYSKENPENVLNNVIFFLILLRKLLYIFVIGFKKINDIAMKQLLKNHVKEEYEIEDEILTIIEESSLDGKIEEQEGELIRNAIEFNDIRVSEILQPKDKIVMVDINDEIPKILKILTQERFSRIPVFDDKEENIIGVFSERDFFLNYNEKYDFELRNILREIVYVPDTLKISKLMIKMQKEHLQMVIVVDERGTIQGLITLEDIIEELVGDIWDEHDEVYYEYHKLDENSYEMIGEISLNVFNNLFETTDIEAETEESTVAGYILELAEKIPNIGEIFEDKNFIYEILDVSGKKIEKIKVINKTESGTENEKSV